MKTTEEKAKAYDKAIEKLRDFYRDYDTVSHLIDVKEELANLFSELAESEDERVRKDVKRAISVALDYSYFDKETANNCLAWLEKQGEQKSNIRERYDRIKDSEWFKKTHEGMSVSEENIEPKFKVGDWITCEELNTALIVNIDDDDKYEVEFVDGNKGFPHIDYIDRLFHLWTIKDAKDGDVLVDNYGNVVIYQEPSTNLMYDSYCYGNQTYFVDAGGSHAISNTYPATKEQRDTLFVKMKEAGYEWDTEKKKLKEIEQNPSWHREDEQNLNAVLGFIPDEYLRRWLKDVIHTKYDKPVWSEDDETGWTNTMIMIKEVASNHYTKDSVKLVIDWLESLKQRMGG